MDTAEFYVSTPTPLPPSEYGSPTRQAIYERLSSLGIPFLRVDTGDGTTMEACIPIGRKLGSPVVKTVFLTNRQHTRFYLYVMPPDRPFETRPFCDALGVARVSFASGEQLLEMLGTPRGATTVLSLVNDPDRKVELILDEGIASQRYISCTDGTTTGFLRMEVKDLTEKFLPSTGHPYVKIDLSDGLL